MKQDELSLHIYQLFRSSAGLNLWYQHGSGDLKRLEKEMQEIEKHILSIKQFLNAAQQKSRPKGTAFRR